ncbi:MAG: extracellular solute-binding protein [Proteobacteria bacterium]|nr:extracellular solute-binding protein [Pseudomonadota bacterium]
MSRISRRKFMKSTAVGAAAAASGGMAGILATGRAPAIAQTATVHWLRWNDFVPAADAMLKDTLIPEAEKALGIKMNFERVNGNDLQPRITSAIQSGAGPDIIMLSNNHPHLYKSSLVDVSDICDEIDKSQGGFFTIAKGNSSSKGKWMSVPSNVVGGKIAWRKSWFTEVGAPNGIPGTWEEYRAVGKKLKDAGHPIGQAVAQSFGDPPTFLYPLLWSFGGSELDESGKVAINSKETIEAIKFMNAFWKDCCDEGGLAWDDSSNNRAFLAGTISATLNGASIYIESLRKPEQYKTEKGTPLKDDIQHAALPAGPKGTFDSHLYHSHVIPNYSKNQAQAKAFLKWFHTPANYEKWFVTFKGFNTPPTAVWENHKMWTEDPVMLPYKNAGKTSTLPGWKGESNEKAAEVLSKYTIINMFAAAIKGQSPEDAVKACEAELKKIYG